MNIETLKEIIGNVSHEAIKLWLKSWSLRHSVSNEAEFYQLLIDLIADGKLRIGDLRTAVLQIEEYGGKRIYVGKLSNSKTIGLRERFLAHIKNKDLLLDQEPVRTRRSTSRPRLDYIYWSQQEVRIGYSETHKFDKLNKATRMLESEPHLNLITISAQPGTGFVKIMMDPQGHEHPHQATFRGDKPEGYIAFYRRMTSELLNAEIRLIDLVKVADALVETKPPIFEPTDSSVLTSHNARHRISSRSDLRDEPVYTAGEKVDGDKWVREVLSGYWLAEPSEKQLHRKLFMQLSRKEEMIWFPADRLAGEVEYALSQIRQIGYAKS